MAIFRCSECDHYIFVKMTDDGAICPTCGVRFKIQWIEKRLFWDKVRIGSAAYKDKRYGVTIVPVCMDMQSLDWLEAQTSVH